MSLCPEDADSSHMPALLHGHAGLTHHSHGNNYNRQNSGRINNDTHALGDRQSRSVPPGAAVSDSITTINGTGNGVLAQLSTLPFRLSLLTICLILAGFTWVYTDVHMLERFLLRLQRDPYGTLPMFLALYVASVVLMFPCMIVQVISGAIYGFSGGLLVSWVATSVGQSLAFLLGRYLFRASVKHYLNQHFPSFGIIDLAMSKEGWKLLCLLRLSPVLPYNVLNYAAALTKVSFVSYSAASAVATIPWTALYTYVGTLSTSVLDLARGKITMQGGASMHGLSPTISAVLMVVGTIYGYVLSKRAINAVLAEAADQQAGRAVAEGATHDEHGGLMGVSRDVEMANGHGVATTMTV